MRRRCCRHGDGKGFRTLRIPHPSYCPKCRIRLGFSPQCGSVSSSYFAFELSTMTNRASLRGFIVFLLSSTASAQLMGLGAASSSPTFATPYRMDVQSTLLDQSLWLIDGNSRRPLEGPN